MSDVALKRQVNLSKTRVDIELLDLETRKRTFREVNRGFTSLKDAQDEARRCLRCPRRPCVEACPINNQIPDFIAKVEEGDLRGAYQILMQKTTLPAVCGRVCPQEKQCEGSCTRGKNGEPVNIGQIERFIATEFENSPDFASFDHDLVNGEVVDAKTDKKVAIIGSGPAGISAADILSRHFVKVDIFESRSYFGGVLSYGIPSFRLPKSVVNRQYNKLTNRGVKVHFDQKFTDVSKFHEILKEYDAVFLANGAQIAKKPHIPGEDLEGVIDALHFLEEATFASAGDNVCDMFEGKKVVVLGGGNVAMDAASTAVRCHASSTTIVYRRSFSELPAREEEVKFNQEEGVEFMLQKAPISILGESGKVSGVIMNDVELGSEDETGRRCPIIMPNTESTIDADVVILAIGSDCDIKFLESVGVKTDKNGHIAVSECFQTSVEKLWAGGDNVTGPLTVVSAMKSGIVAANDILASIDI